MVALLGKSFSDPWIQPGPDAQQVQSILASLASAEWQPPQRLAQKHTYKHADLHQQLPAPHPSLLSLAVSISPASLERFAAMQLTHFSLVSFHAPSNEMENLCRNNLSAN